MAPSHLLFLLLPLLFSMATSEDTCSTSRCSPTEVPVQFPFSLKGDQERCGYPGFELSCNSLNRTVLHIDSWGEFLVRNIYYDTQEVQIYDQDNCLPRRLLNLNLLDSPFRGNLYQSFNFFNCSANFTSDFLQPIACLSTMNYTISAAPYFSRRVGSLSNSCDLLASIMVPTLSGGYGNGYGYATDVTDDLSLNWDMPNCHECIARGGRCGFKNSGSDEIVCFGLATKRGLSSTVKYALSAGLGIPILVSIILITCYLWGRFKSNGTTNHHHHRHHESAVLPQPAVFVMGLNEAVIQSYPMTVLGESRRLVKPEDNICSICLSEYRPKDTLRTIPSCEHCFHAGCIDKWLRRNGTCPLCRDSPKPALPSAV